MGTWYKFCNFSDQIEVLLVCLKEISVVKLKLIRFAWKSFGFEIKEYCYHNQSLFKPIKWVLIGLTIWFYPKFGWFLNFKNLWMFSVWDQLIKAINI